MSDTYPKHSFSIAIKWSMMNELAHASESLGMVAQKYFNLGGKRTNTHECILVYISVIGLIHMNQ